MGRILIVEFDDKELSEFDEIMRILNRHPSYVSHRLRDESVLSFANLEIYPERRKVYCDHKKINLTAKEYDLLFLLITNRDIVLTYELIYQSGWGEEGLGNERNAVGCHIRNLRKKLHDAAPDLPFKILCVREIGYCLDTDNTETEPK